MVVFGRVSANCSRLPLLDLRQPSRALAQIRMNFRRVIPHLLEIDRRKARQMRRQHAGGHVRRVASRGLRMLHVHQMRHEGHQFPLQRARPRTHRQQLTRWSRRRRGRRNHGERLRLAPRGERHARAPRAAGHAVVHLGDNVHERSGKLTGATIPGDGKIKRAPGLASRDMRKLDARRRAGERSAGSVWKWKRFK